MKPETYVIHAPVVETPADNRPLNFPVYQNVKWETETIDDALGIVRGQRPGYFYSRVSNPTVHQLETLLASLQGREQCLATAGSPVGLPAASSCFTPARCSSEYSSIDAWPFERTNRSRPG